MTLREVLHAHVPMLNEQSTVRDAIDKMDIYQFPALVVLNGDMRPVAVVTEGDVCRAVTHHESLARLKDEPVLSIATSNPTVQRPELEVGEALHQMISQGLTVLPIVEADMFCGVVFRVDLMNAMLLDATPQP